MATTGNPHPQLDGAFFGWLRKMAHKFFCAYGAPPEENELIAAGFLVAEEKLPTYSPSAGPLENYCWPRTLGAWKGMVRSDRREPPIGRWCEALMGVSMVPLSLDDSDDVHLARLGRLADSAMAADALCVQDDAAVRIDGDRAMALLKALPEAEAEPGRSLLVGICVGKGLSEQCRERKIKRHVGRFGVEKVLQRLGEIMLDGAV